MLERLDRESIFQFINSIDPIQLYRLLQTSLLLLTNLHQIPGDRLSDLEVFTHATRMQQHVSNSVKHKGKLRQADPLGF